MNTENPFQPPGEATVLATDKSPNRSKLIIAAMYVWIVITFFINAFIAYPLLERLGFHPKDVYILFYYEMILVYLIISSLALFKCTFKTYVIATAVLIAVLFARTYIDCVMYDYMAGLWGTWINFTVVAIATPYLYVAESFLIRKIRSPARD